jgi:hypothetical protein
MVRERSEACCETGGYEKALGCGVNVLVAFETNPNAVELSSSSLDSATSEGDDVPGKKDICGRPCPARSSFELLKTRSDSLSVSSYSSWLLDGWCWG